MTEVWTSRIDTIGRDPDAIDITRAGAKALPNGPGVAFAPSWGLLLLGKRGELSDREYDTTYTEEMRVSYVRRRDAWRSLLARPRAVVCCYCTDPEACHRTIFARDILPKCGAVYRGELRRARALSVRQPWAHAILHGKDIENRGGPTWTRGPLPPPSEWIALHASGGCTRDEYEAATWAMGIHGDIGSRLASPLPPVPPLAELPRGGIVGRFRIAERVTSSESAWFEGPIGLRVVDVQPLPFARCAGALGFFWIPAELAGEPGSQAEPR